MQKSRARAQSHSLTFLKLGRYGNLALKRFPPPVRIKPEPLDSRPVLNSLSLTGSVTPRVGMRVIEIMGVMGCYPDFSAIFGMGPFYLKLEKNLAIWE